jgi:hypothetical protein
MGIIGQVAFTICIQGASGIVAHIDTQYIQKMYARDKIDETVEGLKNIKKRVGEK